MEEVEKAWCYTDEGFREVELMHNSWISVKDRLPENMQRVLVIGTSMAHIAYIDKTISEIKGQFWWRDAAPGLYFDEITHWMPIPPLPEEKK